MRKVARSPRLRVGLIAFCLLSSTLTAQAVAPELPRVFIDTTYAPPSGGTTRTVNAGGDLQAAINAAVPGDIIVLQAGATFTGNFTLPNKAGSGWVYIISSALASLPGPGNRVSPSVAASMPKIVSPNSSSAITGGFGAHHYRFVGIEIATSWAVTSGTHYNLILFGYDLSGNPATTLSQLPHDITFDRCYIHGTPTGNVRRGIALNGINLAVIDSYLSEFHEEGADTQALWIGTSPGPMKIVNNELQAAGENVMFGGGDPSIPNLIPADIEIRSNHFFKPTSWIGSNWSVKNLLEFKNAQRVLVEGNYFENNWAAAQNGFSLLITPRNQSGGCPGCGTLDITIRLNKMLNFGQGFNISGQDSPNVSLHTDRVLVQNNLVQVTSLNGADGRIYQTIGGPTDVTIDHNTAFTALGTLSFNENTPKADRFVFTNNLSNSGTYGFTGTDTGAGLSTLNTHFSNYTFLKNVIIGGNGSAYPSGNFFPATTDVVGFVNLSGSDYHLSASSPYKNAGTDGKDLGADIDALNAATSCAVSGICGASPPPPPPPAYWAENRPPAGTPHSLPTRLFPADNWWNNDISKAPVDPKSPNYIVGLAGVIPWYDWGNNYGLPYTTVSSNYPKVRFSGCSYWSETDDVDYPIPIPALTEPGWTEDLTGTIDNPVSTGDRHLLIVDTDNQYLYEIYQPFHNSTNAPIDMGGGNMLQPGNYWCASAAFWDMKTNNTRPDGWTSSDAAGLQVLPGLVQYDEVMGSAPITHAHRFTLNFSANTPPLYVWPATHYAGSYSATHPPLGARFRLKANKDISYAGPHAQKLLQSMKDYGLIFADNGTNGLIVGTNDARWGPYDGPIRTEIGAALGGLTFNDFEVVQLGWKPTGGTPPPPGALPTPTLNLPAYVPVNGTLTVDYPSGYSNIGFQWTITPKGSSSYSPSHQPLPAGRQALPTEGIKGEGLISKASSANFQTSSNVAGLASYGLAPGLYTVTVQAFDSSGNVSAQAAKDVTLVQADFSSMRVYPNPWRNDKHSGTPVTFDHLPLGSTVKIFTVSGRWVKTLTPAVDTVPWDLTNDKGSKVASGLYMYLITVGDTGYGGSGDKKTGQIAVIK